MKNKLLKLIMMSSKFTFYGLMIQLLLFNLLLASNGNAQLQSQSIQSIKEARVTLQLNNASIEEIFQAIEKESEYEFFYDRNFINRNIRMDVNNSDVILSDLLMMLSEKAQLKFRQVNNVINVTEMSNSNKKEEVIEVIIQTRNITGKVTSMEDDEGLPGVNVVEKGTSNGTVTDVQGNYSLEVSEGATLVFSSVGYTQEEVEVGNRSTVDLVMNQDIQQLEELVVVGYGTMEKSDLTGAIGQADIEAFREQPNVSLAQSLQGSVAGLNVGQINQAGEEPNISIRGRTSLSGAQNPLIILDGVIFRGNLIDINPADIKSVDVLKDNSAAAVYGSQAANGVILITSKSGTTASEKPVISYSSNIAFQSPTVDFRPGNGQDFIRKNTEIDWRESRTQESGYLEPRPDYPVEGTFKTNEQVETYLAGRETNWYDLVTNDNMYVQNHNLSLSNRNEFVNYFISAGLTDQKGYMFNEDYQRYNARINLDNHITDWMTIGVQTFASFSDYSGQELDPDRRYAMIPFDAAYDADGNVNQILNGLPSPLAVAEADDFDKRTNLFGNIYLNIDFPFIKGLTYKVNFYNNYKTERNYYFRPYGQNFQGEGSKSFSNWHDMLSDNILTFKRIFNEKHKIDLTLLYGFEKRNFDFTNNVSSIFLNPVLGYNRLQAGDASLQQANSGAWEESSIYNMARLLYSFDDRYMITGTIRRDGFSGFSEEHKFGIFPSVALGWVASEESFFQGLSDVVNYLKLRVSYGSIGNRTIDRYQTLAKVSGGFGYVNENGTPLYTQSITSLASPELRWETTTGINLGIDFGVLNSRISGSIEYYNNNTNNLLYNVDLPSIARFGKFPDNLGQIHNHGIELSLSTVNVESGEFTWTSDFAFSRNRDELRELLGFDNNNDGKEDDLISEGLFIGEPLDVVFHYEVDGLYQLNDEIPAGAMVGSYKIVDQNGDGTIDQENDFKILGYRNPSYRFSINNQLNYKNWTFRFFINAIQGGGNFYYGADNIHFYVENQGFANTGGGQQHFWLSYPENIDYWLPENPNAKYQTPNLSVPPELNASRWTQRSFMRLQDVSLAYNFDNQLLDKVKVNNLKIFISGKNLFTWTNWPGWDPETGEGLSRTGRPVLKSYTIGLNFEF